jgi:thiol:disulfide interchange protein DsbD
MVGDWTNKNQQILEFLGQYQRAGVPLYVVYAGEDYEQVLPQILSPSMVVDAINLAKQEIEK